ncbi:MAG: hypothetical protein IKE69_05835 [Thermoguttaceae bacterium]|nr:hypothetical protein [Thermoguttaceae bacterium]
MFKHAVSSFVLLSCLCFVSACRKTDYPAGFPKIHPVQIKVVENGSPMEGVQVVVHYNDNSLTKWRTSGFAGSDGIVKLMTRGFEGAPEGEAVFLLEKRDPPVKQDENGNLVAGNTENQLDDRFSDPEETPFKGSISKKQSGIIVIDLGSETVSN